ncbi:MAG: hypothetical protein IJ278_04295 [Clostridia bacterium]|nr:hypothetical protein [Clostridia bacterium]
MKKIFISVLCIVLVLIGFIVGVKIKNHFADEMNDNPTAMMESETEYTSDNSIKELPISDVENIAKQSKNGFTKQDAELLCQEVLGEQAEETGFPVSYRCIAAVSAKDQLYYVMHIAWFVNNSHWSYIGNCFVSIDGQEIYDGVVSDGIYEMTELRWKQ